MRSFCAIVYNEEGPLQYTCFIIHTQHTVNYTSESHDRHRSRSFDVKRNTEPPVRTTDKHHNYIVVSTERAVERSGGRSAQPPCRHGYHVPQDQFREVASYRFLATVPRHRNCYCCGQTNWHHFAYSISR